MQRYGIYRLEMTVVLFKILKHLKKHRKMFPARQQILYMLKHPVYVVSDR